MEFKTHLASIVCCLCLLNKQISGHSFPTWDDALRIDVSTVLAQPKLISNHRYRTALPRHIQREIIAEPWAASLPISEIVDEVERHLRSNEILDQVTVDMESIFDSDPTVYSVVRRGLQPIRNADIIVEAVDATSEAFGIEYNTLEESVRTMYFGLFRRIVMG